MKFGQQFAFLFLINTIISLCSKAQISQAPNFNPNNHIISADLQNWEVLAKGNSISSIKETTFAYKINNGDTISTSSGTYHVLYFDREGRIVKDSSSSSTEYLYDRSGRITEIQKDFSISKYYYDPKGRVKSVAVIKRTTQKLTNILTCAYDSNGNAYLTTSFSFDDKGDSLPMMKTEYTFNDDHNLHSAREVFYSNDDSVVNNLKFYYSDSCILSTDSGNVSCPNRFKYDLSFRLIESTYCSDQYGVVTEKTKYVIDENKKINAIRHETKSNGLADDVTIEISYDKDKMPLRQISHETSKMSKVRIDTYSYTFYK